MKAILKIFSTIIIAVSLSSFVPAKTFAQGATVSFQVFYDNLSPYGQWVDYPDYGYAWIPDVDANFSPYATNGYWVMTDYGWTWVSNYSWGWAPFHYGRWQYDDMYGWAWFPDTQWAPAWVVWRRAPGYYGWAPIGPRVSLDVAFSPSYRVPDDRWVFVNERDIVRPDIDRYYVNRGNNVTIIKNTTVINNVKEDNSTHVKYVAGPDKSEVERNTGAQVKVMHVAQSDKPDKTDITNGQLRIYKPAVQKTANIAQKPAPKQVVALKDVKPVTQRNNGNNANGNQNNNNRTNENRPNQQNNQPNNNRPNDLSRPNQENNQPNSNRPNDLNRPNQENNQPNDSRPNDLNRQDNNQNDNNNRVQPENNQNNQAVPTEIQREKLNQPNGSQNVNPASHPNEVPAQEQNQNQQNQRENNQQVNPQQTQPDHTDVNQKAQERSAARRKKVQQQQPTPQQERPVENRDTIPKQ